MREMLRKRYPQLPGETGEKYQERISYEMEEIRAYANQVASRAAYEYFRTTDDEIPGIVDIPYDVFVEVLESHEKDARNEELIQLIDKASHRYRNYLGSTQWQEKRELALRQAGRKCQECGCRTRLQVHHRNYDHVFRELLEDLEVLCEDCHRKAHVRQEAQRQGLHGY